LLHHLSDLGCLLHRFSALDPSLSGRDAEPVYRDKEGNEKNYPLIKDQEGFLVLGFRV